MATCNICKYAGTPSYKSPCSECKGFSKYEYEKPQTNADRIRAMSDEELADTMSMHTATGACNDWGIPHEKCGGNCRECIIDWLKQPVEGEENE